MNVRFLEAFVWVAKLGSFKAAAEKMHTTQAGISSRIARHITVIAEPADRPALAGRR